MRLVGAADEVSGEVVADLAFAGGSVRERPAQVLVKADSVEVVGAFDEVSEYFGGPARAGTHHTTAAAAMAIPAGAAH